MTSPVYFIWKLVQLAPENQDKAIQVPFPMVKKASIKLHTGCLLLPEH